MPRMSFCLRCGKLHPDTEKCSCYKQVQRERNDSKDPAMKKLFNSTRWKKFRKSIIERDGASCQRCLIKYNIITTDNLQVHHVKPRTKYPELMFEKTNCITLCQSCNTQLGIRETLDFEFEFPEQHDYIL